MHREAWACQVLLAVTNLEPSVCFGQHSEETSGALGWFCELGPSLQTNCWNVLGYDAPADRAISQVMQIETENVTRSCESLAAAVSVYGSITKSNNRSIRVKLQVKSQVYRSYATICT